MQLELMVLQRFCKLQVSHVAIYKECPSNKNIVTAVADDFE